MAERLDRDTGVAETTDRRAGAAAAPAGPRWQLLEGAVIGDALSRGDIVLVHPELGLALFQLEPRWTPNALERLRQRLDASGFSSAFPGRLPAIHRRLRREDIPEIGTILAEAFSLQPPLTLPPGGAWVEALRRSLSAAPEAPATGAVEDLAASLGRVTTQTSPSEPNRAPEPRAAAPARGSGPSPLQRNNRPLVIGAGVLAAGLLLVAVLRGPAAPDSAPSEPPQRLAAAGPVATRTDAAPEGPVPPVVLAQAPAPAPPETTDVALAPIDEPPQPQIEPALAALTRNPEPPLPPIDEPPEPRLEPALAALARDAEPPLPPIDEPPEPRLEPALAALARDAEPAITPVEEPPEPRLENALAALARDAEPAITPIEEPPEPRLENALAALARDAEAPPQTSVAQPAAPAATVVPPPVIPLAVPDPPAVVGAMILRGESLLRIGDISGARRFFERAAASGSGAAALAMGGTYDPGVLASLGARGITPDRSTALAWYRYAASLGEARAAERIAALEASR